jgi:hypothetical protein
MRCLLVVLLLLLLLKNQFLLILLLSVYFQAFNNVSLELFAFFVRQFLQIEFEHLLVALRLIVHNRDDPMKLFSCEKLNLLAKNLALCKAH